MVRVRCPATAANLGPGMDALGLALDLWNVFEFEEAPAGFVLEASGVGASRLPADADGSPLVRAYQAARKTLGRDPGAGLRVRVEIEAPPSSGLGSSATAIVAGILAAEALTGGDLGERGRVELATEIEGHPDNVLPCLLGGLCTVARGRDGRLEWLRAVPPEPPVLVALIAKDLELATETMRGVLPREVPFADAVRTVGSASMLVFSLLLGEPRVLPVALDDWLQQPYRGAHVPAFEVVRQAARDAGALGTVISGSGPTLLAFVSDPFLADAVGQAMARVWADAGVDGFARAVSVESAGASVEP